MGGRLVNFHLRTKPHMWSYGYTDLTPRHPDQPDPAPLNATSVIHEHNQKVIRESFYSQAVVITLVWALWMIVMWTVIL